MFRSVLLVFFITVNLLASVTLTAGEINLAPVFSFSSDDEGFRTSALGPLIEFTTGSSAFRPVFYRDNIRHETDVLYPLGRFTEPRSRVFPLYSRVSHPDHSHVTAFPFFSGRYRDRGYGGIFPLYGAMYHRFGFDEASFLLWPIYSRTVKNSEKTYRLFWPVFTYCRDRVLAVFPLYGKRESIKGTYHYVLWPLIHRERGSRTMDAFLPLYWYDRGPLHSSVSILWPFFTYNRDVRADHTSLDIPWPLVRTASGAYEETRVFPLYWKKFMGVPYSMTSYLWPLYVHRESFEPETGIEDELTSILLINRKSRKTGPDDDISERLTVFPLLYRKHVNGHTQWFFPCIIPLFWDDGFVRNWAPLLTLARGTRNETSSTTDILWRTFHLEKNGEVISWSLSFLASYTFSGDQEHYGFFFDLLRFTRHKNTSP
ncbi:MAG: hypothetical protein ACP5G0_03685 [Desulfomonilia bacterium]